MELNRKVQAAGLAAVVGVVFWVLTLVFLTLINLDTYSSLKQPGSELALGRMGWLMDFAFYCLGIGIVALAAGFQRGLDRPRILPYMLGGVGVCLFLSGVFHTKLGSGTHPSVHNTLGLIAFVLTISAMFLASREFGRDPRWHAFARPTLVWACAALAAFFLVPTMGDAYLGLAQRMFVATIFSWFIASALWMRQTNSVHATLSGRH